jgi:hypothetical protein
MPRKASKFTKSEIARAVKAAAAAGLDIASVRVEPDGTIVIIHGAPAIKVVGEVNEWDNAKPA